MLEGKEKKTSSNPEKGEEQKDQAKRKEWLERRKRKKGGRLYLNRFSCDKGKKGRRGGKLFL